LKSEMEVRTRLSRFSWREIVGWWRKKGDGPPHRQPSCRRCFGSRKGPELPFFIANNPFSSCPGPMATKLLLAILCLFLAHPFSSASFCPPPSILDCDGLCISPEDCILPFFDYENCFQWLGNGCCDDHHASHTGVR